MGTGDRSARIRTYNYPQGRVTDHRIGLTLYKLDAILDGALDEVIDALATADRAEKPKAAGAALVFVDGAVIVGAPFEPFCDAIIVVRAPQHVLEQRIVQRDGVSLAAARARLGSQLAQEKLDAAATYILENKESEQALLAQAQTVLENLLKEGMT